MDSLRHGLLRDRRCRNDHLLILGYGPAQGMFSCGLILPASAGPGSTWAEAAGDNAAATLAAAIACRKTG